MKNNIDKEYNRLRQKLNTKLKPDISIYTDFGRKIRDVIQDRLIDDKLKSLEVNISKSTKETSSICRISYEVVLNGDLIRRGAFYAQTDKPIVAEYIFYGVIKNMYNRYIKG